MADNRRWEDDRDDDAFDEYEDEQYEEEEYDEEEYEEGEYDEADDDEYEEEEFEEEPVLAETGRRRRRRSSDDEAYDDESYDDEFEEAPPRRGGRRWLWSLLTLGSLAGALYFAPLIVVNSPLRQSVLDSVSASLDGSLHCGSISASWFAPVVCHNVEVRDAKNNVVLSVPEVRTEKTLWALLNDRVQIGRVHLQSPRLQWVVRNGGDNLMDVLAPLLKASDQPMPAAVVQLEIEDGKVEARRVDQEQVATLHPLAGSCAVRMGAEPLEVKLTLKSGIAGGPPEAIEAQLTLLQKQALEGTLELKAKETPLEPLELLALRFGQPAELSGKLHAEATASWDARGYQLVAKSIRVDDLGFQAADWGAETLRSRQLEIRGAADWRDGTLGLKDLHAQTDWGKLDADGRVDAAQLLEQLQRGDWQQLAALESRANLRLDLDLARLAQELPSLLHLHRDLTFQEGRVAVQLQSAPTGGDGARLEAHVEASQIQATRNGKRLLWRQPVTIHLATLRQGERWSLEQASWQSSFLTAQGQGDHEQGEIRYNGDLAKLHQQVQQFVDLEGYVLAGRADGKLQWKTTANGYRNLVADGQLQDLRLAAPDVGTLEEAEMKFAGLLSLDRQGLPLWNTAELDLAAGADRLQVQTGAGSAGDATRIRLQGDLGRWAARAAPFWPSENVRFEGTVDLTADLAAAADGSVDVLDSDVELKGLRVAAEGIRIDEPQAILKLTGTWHPQPRRWKTGELRLQAASIALASNQLQLQLDPELQLDGAASVRGDWRRLFKSFDALAEAAGLELEGEFDGTGEIRWQRDGGELQWDTRHKNLAVFLPVTPDRRGVRPAAARARNARLLWREPDLKLVGKCRLDPSARKLQIESFGCDADWLELRAQGALQWTAVGGADVDLTGSVNYDWQHAERSLAEISGGQVRIEGRDRRRFSLRGPLIGGGSEGFAGSSPAGTKAPAGGQADLTAFLSPDLEANVAVGWTRALAYGFRVGRGDLNARLRAQRVTLEGLELDVSGGKLAMAPSIELQGPTPHLQLGRGDSLRDVQLSPEMCRSWLKFVAPLLADATRAEGIISVEFGSARLPLSDPAQGDLAATLEIRKAQIGPGGMTQQLLQIAQQVLSVVEPNAVGANLARESWLQLPEQSVPFELRRGRVHHRNLRVLAGSLTIETSGSVGLDETLDLTATIPIQERWLKSDALRNALRGQSLDVRITGTFSRPKFDHRGLQKLLSKGALRGAAEKVLRDEINRGLQRLFGRD